MARPGKVIRISLNYRAYAGETSGLDLTPPRAVGPIYRVGPYGTVLISRNIDPGQGRRALTLVPDYHLCPQEAAA